MSRLDGDQLRLGRAGQGPPRHSERAVMCAQSAGRRWLPIDRVGVQVVLEFGQDGGREGDHADSGLDFGGPS